MKRVVKVLAISQDEDLNTLDERDTYYIKIGSLIYTYTSGALDLNYPRFNLLGLTRFIPNLKEVTNQKEIPQSIINKVQKIADDNEKWFNEMEEKHSEQLRLILERDPEFIHYF